MSLERKCWVIGKIEMHTKKWDLEKKDEKVASNCEYPRK
jgi:hypothetical protein